ncbi:MAG: hypothetical protein J6334_03405 [Kiritimatiellae bacterium]|nr:hypothetical protein [Kiritimatiellia bacterium]
MRDTANRLMTLLLMIGVSGCMTTRERIARYGLAVSNGRYQEAAQVVSDAAHSGTNDGLCWQLHKGSALALQGELEASTQTFDAAEDAYWNRDETSAVVRGTEHGVALLLNDAAYPYTGSGYERIFCSLYKALNYAALGDRNAARVEFNRAGERQTRYFEERTHEIQKEERTLQDNLTRNENRGAGGLSQNILASGALGQQIQQKCGYDYDLSQSPEAILGMLAARDFYNAYAGHARAVFRMLDGDSAWGDFKQVAAICPDIRMVGRDTADFRSGAAPQHQVWVYVEDGLCPVREETRIDLPLGLIPYQNHILYTGMALPYLIYRPEASDHYTVGSAREQREMELLLDVDRLVKTEFDIRFHGVVAREVARLVIRSLPQIALEEAARHDRQNADYYRLGKVLSVGFNLATIKADLRLWSGLPKRVYGQRLTFTPGEPIKVGTRYGDIEIPMPAECVNAMVIVKKPAAIAAPVVTIIPF